MTSEPDDRDPDLAGLGHGLEERHTDLHWTRPGVSEEAIHFLADAGTGPVEVRVPFLEPVTGSGEVRVAVVRLARHAREVEGA